MSSSIFKKPKVGAPQGRNGFDLSFHRSFTTSCGMLLPIAHDIANPGDKYVLNSQSFVRTEAVETAAFCELKMHVDWFFVPMTQIYSRWNEFYNQVDDVMSSLFVSDNSTPYKYELPKFSVFPALFGFFDGKPNDFFATSSVSGQNTIVKFKNDPYGLPYYWNFRRLWDMLGYGSVDTTASITLISDFTLLPFLAYHKIFHSHYMPTDWFKNDPLLYNVDSYVNPSRVHSPSELPAIISTLHYRPYRKDYFTNILPSPIFSDVYANYISGSFDADFMKIINPEARDSGNSLYLDYSVNDSDTQTQLRPVSGSTVSGFSTADLRSMYALDKLLRVNAFSKSHYADQVFAHFGYKMPEGISDEAYKLGSQTIDIGISQVLSTASTEDTALGEVGGKGFGATPREAPKDIKFTAPCHGIIMGICSIEPIPRYASRFCERQNRYQSTYDFYHEEFDNVGMQPLQENPFYTDFYPEGDYVFGWQYRYSENKTKVDIVNEGFWNTKRKNWTPTKQGMYPLDNNDVHVIPSLESTFYVFPQYTNTMFALKVPFYNSFTALSFTAPTSSLDAQSVIFSSGVDWHVGANEVYQYDNFMVDTFIKMFKTSIMSVHSLPKIM
ncbi:MAG: major capsid protein [Microviridae sp.]|nr:MAG: major capsid protein [Microviridae sp.]